MGGVVLVPDGADRGLPWHYGDPFGEQRRMATGHGAVVLGNRGVISISGADRLIWLGAWVAEPLSAAPLDTGVRLTLIGDDGTATGVLNGCDDGAALWAVVDGEWPVIGYWMQQQARQSGQDASVALWPSDQRVPVWLGDAHPLRRRTEVSARIDTPIGLGHLVIAPPDQAAGMVADEPVGLWAFEALRIAALVPRPPLDQLSAGGRRLHLVHLDGSADDPTPAIGTVLTLEGRDVGRLGTCAQHYELGPIGLAVVDTGVPKGTSLLAGETAALVD